MSRSDLISIFEDGSLLAIGTSNALKLWDTSSGILEHEFHPGEYLSSAITCLQFAPKFKRKKRGSDITIEAPSNVSVALGTLNGDILIYSIAEQEVKEQLKHSENSVVKSLSWPSPNLLVSLGKKKLIAWGRNKVKLWEFNYGGDSLCALGENHYVIGTTSLHFLKYHPNKSHSYAIPAHKTSICTLVPVSINNEKRASYVLSAANSDRFVYAWQTNDKVKEPVGSFMVGDVVKAIDCSSIADQTVGIIVTTQKGCLRYFSNHFNGSNHLKPLKYQASLSIKSQSNKKSDSLIPILSARFLSSSQILIVYGSELFPRCERVSVDSLDGEVWLVREDPSLFPVSKKKSGLVKTITPQVPNTALHIAPSRMNPPEMKEVNKKRKKSGETSAALPMENRLDALSLSKPLSGGRDSRPLDSYVHLLGQALHSKDSSLMNSILAKGEDEEIINNTVRRLPVAEVVPFLQYLQQVIIGKGLKNLTCINWIKSLLYHHMSLLSTVPNKKDLLEPFYTVFATRTASMLAVTKLHARISLLLMHVKNRHDNVTQNNTEDQFHSLVQYRDDSSDDEHLRLEMEGGPSESEDIWDDWTEDDDDNDNDEGKGEKRTTTKRKLADDEELVSVSDSEEEIGADEEVKGNGHLTYEEDDDNLSSGEDDERPASDDNDEENPASEGEGDHKQSASEDDDDQSDSEDELSD